jgi:hypothetical protein
LRGGDKFANWNAMHPFMHRHCLQEGWKRDQGFLPAFIWFMPEQGKEKCMGKTAKKSHREKMHSCLICERLSSDV